MPTPTKVVKPTCERAWPANVCPRSTRKKPTVPARIAAIPEAAKAVRMKSYSNTGVVVAMRVALDVDIFVEREHEIAALGAHDLDLRSIEARQHRPRHDFVDRTDHRRARAEVKHPVDGVDQRVEFVCAEHD